MEQEDLINRIMESASKIKEVEANPFLYQKIVTRLNRSENDSTAQVKSNLGWATVFIIVVVLNISALTVYKVKSDNRKESTAIENLSNEMIACTTDND